MRQPHVPTHRRRFSQPLCVGHTSFLHFLPSYDSNTLLFAVSTRPQEPKEDHHERFYLPWSKFSSILVFKDYQLIFHSV